VTRGWEEARSRHAGIEVPIEQFAGFVAERMDPGDEPVAALDALRLTDLYLVCGCTAGDPAALGHLDRLLREQVRPSLTRIATAELIDESEQIVRERLLVAGPDHAPRIGDYQGRGALVSWLRMAAIRTIHNLRRKTSREVLVADDRLADHLLFPEDSGLSRLKSVYRQQFKLAFADAVASLGARERTLLRQHHLDGVASDGLARVHGVHRATVSRWIVKAQQELFQATRRALMARLGTSSREVDSVLDLINSQLEVSAARLLDGDDED
jgi:RNA polymerase sigma-70 factor (ECF subfamily)